jgi:hypothetical protein
LPFYHYTYMQKYCQYKNNEHIAHNEMLHWVL